MGDSNLILGINLGETSYGKELRDGGACILKNGKVEIAIAEERITRKKADGGFRKSLEYCLNTRGYTLDDFDQIVYSSCVDKQAQHDLISKLDVDESIVEPVSHHLSHARSAYHVSGFDSAVVGVFDAGGDIIDGETPSEWWKCEREQQSYYLARNGEIELLHRDFDGPYEAGIGEIYRAFTHYLGFGSYINSGKTMGLAAYGNPDRYDIKLFHFNDGEMRSKIKNDPKNPVKMVNKFADQYNADFGIKRDPDEDISEIHKDIAAYLQDQIERALVSKFQYLYNVTDTDQLATAGGVALNCVANREILENTNFEGMFVQPAAGDKGQCLGNALHGYHGIIGKRESFEMKMPYFGEEYDLNERTDVLTKAEDDGHEISRFNHDGALSERAADLLADGEIVALFLGGAEFGPRALGHRSILADPRDKNTTKKLNRIKDRHEFRPYAPSILKDTTEEWFSEDWYSRSSDTSEKMSQFMIVVSTVNPSKRDKIPAVVHHDGTARLQEVDESTSQRYYKIIDKFGQKTDIPILLNTSFNRGGEPIVETPADAYECFEKTLIDNLLLEDTLITKNNQ